MPGLLRICTAGSVDDGKSTLIGRLLHDAKALYEDQIQSVASASRHRSAGPVDFSLFTDGLKAEREQGITIDVAYRYFTTARRRFILADTPGHEQYTRNMATGASNSDLAVILVDARQGLTSQTRLHARIARLLGIRAVVLAVNKMDLVAFDQDRFDAIVSDFHGLTQSPPVRAIPISARDGDNVTTRSGRMPWYDGPPLLEFLETVDVDAAGIDEQAFRFPVQLVVRAAPDFRGYAGQVTSGAVRIGDVVTAWPSGRQTSVRGIVTWEGAREEAGAGRAIVLDLAPAIDLGRGDILAGGPMDVTRRFEAEIVWMDERPLEVGRVYLLRHAARTVTAQLDASLALNEIGSAVVTTSAPLAIDRYADRRATGSFILIDPASAFTCGAGVIRHARPADGDRPRLNAARTLAILARRAVSDADAIAAIEQSLEEILR